MHLKKRQKKYLRILLGVLTAVFVVGSFLLFVEKTAHEDPKFFFTEQVIAKLLGADIIKKPLPAPVDMAKLRSQGCVADGLLSEYTPESEKFVALINRSNCYYLHRAIETWLKPPDFDTVSYEMSKITKKNVVYGMFLAEALDTRAKYEPGGLEEPFDFEKMCREGSEDAWGPHTCKPDFGSGEYRRYLEYITERAMDLGVQSFTFGQIYMQEHSDKEYAPKIISNMREYARKKGLNIVIGAQTNAITDPEYLNLFDYIEGGVGLKADGSVENGPCLSTRGSCWALLWHNDFASKAKNVLLNLDWTGIPSDDLDIFARMDAQTRARTLQNLYQKFNQGNTGFMMPFSGALYNENGGCRGPKKKFYSPDNAFSCKDEDAINKILKGV